MYLSINKLYNKLICVTINISDNNWSHNKCVSIYIPQKHHLLNTMIGLMTSEYTTIINDINNLKS